MKTLLIKYAPAWLLKLYKSIKGSKYNNQPIDKVFNDIYKNNYWKSSESVSGLGSEIVQTETLRIRLEKLFKEFEIKSILDLPCGDFKWMQKVDLSNLNYIGGDIVEEIIRNNQKKFKENKNVKFKVLNLTKDKLPEADVVIVRDCLVHFSYSDIFLAIKNLKSSGSKYLLTTTFTNRPKNYDIVTGDWRILNLQIEPFNFPKPILIINENCTEDNGIYKDKSMAFWEISKI